MGRWLARRLIITLVSFIGFTMLVFALMRLAAGEPVDLMLFNMHQNGGLSTDDMQPRPRPALQGAGPGSADPGPVRDLAEDVR